MADLPFAESVGYQIRTTHRAMQRFLQSKIEPHGITLGMWYFLRALWHEDGLTQRELSNRAGTMEPTTLSAILIMEKKGLVRRVRNRDDRRKWHIHLTPRGRALKSKLASAGPGSRRYRSAKSLPRRSRAIIEGAGRSAEQRARHARPDRRSGCRDGRIGAGLASFSGLPCAQNV